jgi:hypothetical protein
MDRDLGRGFSKWRGIYGEVSVNGEGFRERFSKKTFP